MEKKNLQKLQRHKRRKHSSIESKDFINDLLEKKISENKLINTCISGNIPEKARPLVWKILLNIIPLNKPEEWIIYFKKLTEIYYFKIEKYLKIKEKEEIENNHYDIIDKQFTNINNENINKSNFSNVCNLNNLKRNSFEKNHNEINLKHENHINNASDEIENKDFNNTQKNNINIEFRIFDKEQNKCSAEIHLNGEEKETEKDSDNLKLLNKNIIIKNIFSDNNTNNENKLYIDLYDNNANNKHNINNNNDFNNNNLYENREKTSEETLELSPKINESDKFYLFFSEDENFSIEKMSENSQIIEASRIIRLDIERTFQEIDLFRSIETKESLCKILFIWYSENSDLGYKQGMNEILGTILYSSFNITEQQIFERMEKYEEDKHLEFFAFFESEDFFPVILFTLYDQIFSLGLKSIYDYHSIIDTKEFSYNEEKSNFSFLRNEIDLIFYEDNLCKNNTNDKVIEINGDHSNIPSNKITLLEKDDFIMSTYCNNKNKSDLNIMKIFNFDNITNFISNKKDRVRMKISESIKSIKKFIKKPWQYKKDEIKKVEKNRKLNYQENKNKKIDFRIFESENMDRLKLDEILDLEQSDLRRRVNIIFYYYLKSYDPELYNHLLHKIDPYIIIFRWILCLFNREISLKYVKYIWDCIFAIEFMEKNSNIFLNSFKDKSYKNIINNLNFVNFICVSIFEDLRKELIQEEESCFVLQMLMHFPNEKNVFQIVKRALKIRGFIYSKLHILDEFVLID